MSIKAKLKAAFEKRFGPPAFVIDPNEMPLRLLLGSLRDCSEKDARAYARGLAESFVTATEQCRLQVKKDPNQNRYLFEIHEGGPGASILDAVMSALETEKQVCIQLANGAHVSIEDTLGEVLTLLYSDKDKAGLNGVGIQSDTTQSAPIEHISKFCSNTVLPELMPENHKLAYISAVILGLTSSVFILTGLSYTVLSSGVIDADVMVRQAKAGHVAEGSDNPVWQLEKARADAEKTSSEVSVLKRDKKGWSWELKK